MFDSVGYTSVNKDNGPTKTIAYPTNENINFMVSCIWNGSNISYDYQTIPLSMLVANRIIEHISSDGVIYGTITVNSDKTQITMACNYEWYILLFWI